MNVKKRKKCRYMRSTVHGLMFRLVMRDHRELRGQRQEWGGRFYGIDSIV